eukprot:13808652-Ditylum_brightwellii.AAC.1
MWTECKDDVLENEKTIWVVLLEIEDHMCLGSLRKQEIINGVLVRMDKVSVFGDSSECAKCVGDGCANGIPGCLEL